MEPRQFEESDMPRQGLTFAQREIYTGQQLDVTSPLYNMGMLYHIRGALDLEKFSTAWRNVVSVSDALRTRLVQTQFEPGQVVCDETIPMHTEDFSSFDNPLTTAKTWVQDEIEKPISLNGPLVRSVLIRLADDHWLWFCLQHHIITDASSFASIWKAMTRHYCQPHSETDLPMTGNYSSYIQAQLERQFSDTAAATDSHAQQYWQSRELPRPVNYYGRKPVLTRTDSTRLDGFFSEARAQQLEALIKVKGISSFSPHLARFQVLLTVLFAYLYRISGQTDLTIATTAPNRSDPAYAHTPGLFVELLALSVTVKPGDTFATLHSRVKLEVMNFLKHSRPGAGAWTPNREISTVLNHIPITMDSLGDMPVATEWLHPQHMDRQHAMRLHATDWNNTGKVQLSCDFNDSCFSPEQRADALNHWLALFDGFVCKPERTIDSVDIVQNDRQRSLLVDHTFSTAGRDSDSRAEYDRLVAEIMQTGVRYGDEIAVSQNQSTMTYRELLERADTLSATLARYGLGNGHRIAVFLPRCMAIPVVLLGILKSGATYVPIEPNNPQERIQALLDDAQAGLVITDTLFADRLPAPANTLVIEPDGEIKEQTKTHADSLPESETHERESSVTHDSSAYILYTSGSTGAPKGVAISRDALYNYCAWAVDHYASGRRLTFAFFTPLGFDLTVTSLFVPLLSGGQVRVYPASSDNIDNSLPVILEENRVDIVKLTPAHLSLLQHEDLKQSSIKQLIVGGDDLKCQLAQNVYHRFAGDVIIHNEYGPTEATVGCIVHRFDPESDTVGSVPIGKPVAGMTACLLNDAHRVQPAGVSGILYLSGPSLADGYWNRRQQTEDAFKIIANPDNQRFYRTGDLARLNESGELVYLGREDNQQKIRGARIELAEIESTVLERTAATNCVVITVSNLPSVDEDSEQFCNECGLSSLYPDATINSSGVCSLCIGYKKYETQARKYFKTMQELESVKDDLLASATGKYHCMMLLSGGKDSTYALARLQSLGLNVLAYTLDNGYLSTEAKINIKKVCRALKVDHEFGETPAMRKIFADSLEQFSNVCNGCFKTIYTLSMKRAEQLGIPCIFTGLSRGQFFETRLTEELFMDDTIDIEKIDQMVLQARKAYHRMPDAFSRLIDTSHFKSDDIFAKVQILDFYRYCDVDLDEMLDFLQQQLPWIRPADTGRSTNCLINDVGIFVHKKQQGFHNYSLPYSWDVRLGHKQRDAALEELNDDIDTERVNSILNEIGYQYTSNTAFDDQRLALYYTAESPVAGALIKKQLSEVLPAWMIPDWFVQMDTLPLSENGKVQRSALPTPKGDRTIDSVTYVPATSHIEKQLAEIWSTLLKINRVGIEDNFFELGGDSLSAIRVVGAINREGFAFSTSDLFVNQTISQLAALHIERHGTEAHPAQHSTGDKKPVRARSKPFASLSSTQMKKLADILDKSASKDNTPKS